MLLLDNVLCAFSDRSKYSFHIRSFDTDTVSTHQCDPDHPVKVRVQHGDVIAVNRRDECPLFLNEQANFTGLSGKVRFERVKSFCYLASSRQVVFWPLWKATSLQGRGGILWCAEGI